MNRELAGGAKWTEAVTEPLTYLDRPVQGGRLGLSVEGE